MAGAEQLQEAGKQGGGRSRGGGGRRIFFMAGGQKGAAPTKGVGAAKVATSVETVYVAVETATHKAGRFPARLISQAPLTRDLGALC
jgi:hypothetical protein